MSDCNILVRETRAGNFQSVAVKSFSHRAGSKQCKQYLWVSSGCKFHLCNAKMVHFR